MRRIRTLQYCGIARCLLAVEKYRAVLGISSAGMRPSSIVACSRLLALRLLASAKASLDLDIQGLVF
jgi:hypothetical protein